MWKNSQFDSILELMKMMTSRHVEATYQLQLQLEISREQARLQVVNYEATLKAADLQAQQQMKLMHAHLEQFRQQIALSETWTVERCSIKRRSFLVPLKRCLNHF